jgi:predicted metal-dependent hydrolase
MGLSRSRAMAPRGIQPVEETQRRIHLGATAVPYVLRRSARVRGIRLTIDGRRGLVVSVPPAGRRGWASADDHVESFLRERQAWVLRHLAKLETDWAEIAARGTARDGGSIHYRGELHRIRVVAAAPGGAGRSIVERTGADDGDELVVRQGARDRRAVERVLEAWLRERATDAITRAVGLHAPARRVTPAEVVLRDPKSRWGSAAKRGRLMFSWRLVLAPPDALETVVVHELAHLRVFGHGPGFWKLVASRRPDHLADRAWLRKHSHALHAALESAPDA